jgi:hypothetical protein
MPGGHPQTIKINYLLLPLAGEGTGEGGDIEGILKPTKQLPSTPILPKIFQGEGCIEASPYRQSTFIDIKPRVMVRISDSFFHIPCSKKSINPWNLLEIV